MPQRASYIPRLATKTKTSAPIIVSCCGFIRNNRCGKQKSLGVFSARLEIPSSLHQGKQHHYIARSIEHSKRLSKVCIDIEQVVGVQVRNSAENIPSQLILSKTSLV